MCVIDFFPPVSSFDIWFVGDWVSWFFHWLCFKSNDTGHEFWRVDTVRDSVFFFYIFFNVFTILHFFKKIGFVVILILFLYWFIPISWLRQRVLQAFFLIEVFFKMFCFVFNFWRISFYICTDKIYFIKKYLFWNNISNMSNFT